MLRRWKHQVEEQATDAFPGNGHLLLEQDELSRLRGIPRAEHRSGADGPPGRLFPRARRVCRWAATHHGRSAADMRSFVELPYSIEYSPDAEDHLRLLTA